VVFARETNIVVGPNERRPYRGFSFDKREGLQDDYTNAGTALHTRP
jgi:hypothetical protein